MNILGYIVQCFHEEKFLPDTGYKHLIRTYTHALRLAREKADEYLLLGPLPAQPFELKSPSKKDVDENGYAMIFQNGEYQIWIEAIVE